MHTAPAAPAGQLRHFLLPSKQRVLSRRLWGAGFELLRRRRLPAGYVLLSGQRLLSERNNLPQRRLGILACWWF